MQPGTCTKNIGVGQVGGVMQMDPSPADWLALATIDRAGQDTPPNGSPR